MKSIGRVLLWVCGVLVVLEILYVLTGLVLVQSGQVDRWVNKNPDKLQITFDSAWTFLPGLVHVQGARVVHQGRGEQLEVTVDRAQAFINPLALTDKTVSARSLEASGVEFRFRKRPKTAEDATDKGDFVPPIEGVIYEPYGGPPKTRKKRQDKKGWTVDVGSGRATDVREVWMGPVRLQGRGTADASVLVETGAGTRLSIRSADIRFADAELTVKNEPFSRNLALHVNGRMDPFNTRETKGKAILGLVSGKVELSGTGTGKVLNSYFRNVEWVRFRGEPRTVTAKFEIDKGRLRPGSYVDLDKELLASEFAGFIVEGQAGVRLETVPAPDGSEVHVKVEFTDYGMRRLLEGPPVMLGEGLVVEARSSADLMQIPPETFDGQIQLGKAMFPDLTFVNEMLPKGGNLRVKSGKGTVNGGFEIEDAAACRGSVKIRTEELVLAAAGIENDGDVEVTVEVPDGDLNELKFGIDHTRIELKNFAFSSEGYDEELPPWQGRFEVTSGNLDLGETKGASGHLEIFLTDTRPLVAFLSKDKPMKGWRKKLLMIEEITGESVAEMGFGTTTIRHFGIRGEALDIRFRATIDSKGAFGKARARYGALKAGIGLKGEDRELKILRVGSWYRENDIPGMPSLLPQYEEAVDVAAEEEEAAAAEARAAEAAQAADKPATHREAPSDPAAETPEGETGEAEQGSAPRDEEANPSTE